MLYNWLHKKTYYKSSHLWLRYTHSHHLVEAQKTRLHKGNVSMLHSFGTTVLSTAFLKLNFSSLLKPLELVREASMKEYKSFRVADNYVRCTVPKNITNRL